MTAAKRDRNYRKAIVKFQQDSAPYVIQRGKDIEKFITEVHRIQYAEADPPQGTDIMSVLNTTTLFLNGSAITVPRTAQFLSDGIDNQYVKVASEPEPGMEFIWVSDVPITNKIPQAFHTDTKAAIGNALAYIKLAIGVN